MPMSNVLASRYGSADLVNLWSPHNKVIYERQLWIAVMRAQRSLGIDIPAEIIADYEKVIDQVDLESIAQRERSATMSKPASKNSTRWRATSTSIRG